MSSSSKVKNLSQVSGIVSSTNSSSVSSAADAQIFNDVFDKTRIDDVAAQQGASDESGSEKNSQDAKESSSPKLAKKSDGSSAGQKADGTDSTEETDEVSEAKDAEELSAEEKNEIEEMEKYRLSVDELARQLNVAMAAQQQIKPQVQNIKIVFKGPEHTDMQSALKSIDPALLRKVDIRALDEQLRKLMNGDGLLNVDVPADTEGTDAAGLNELMNQAVDETALASEAAQIASDTAENALNQALMGVETEDSGLDTAVLDRLAEISQDARVLVDFKDAMGDIQDRADRIASWQDGLKGMKDGAQALNLSTQGEASEDRLEAANNFIESMHSYADKTHFDPTETLSDKKFTFDGGAAAPAPSGAAAPVVIRNLFLNVSLSGQSAGVKITAGPLKGDAASHVPAIDAKNAAKIGAKVQEIVMETVQAGKADTTRIQLHPETLGKIDIKITMKEKMVSAEIITDNPEAKEAILRHMPQIKAVLAGENLMLENFTARHDHQHFQAQQQQQAFAGDGSPGHRSGGGLNQGPAADAVSVMKAQGASRRIVAADSLINITV